MVLCISLIVFSSVLCAEGLAQTNPSDDELNLLDLLIARPAGIAAGIAGTAVFVVTLPFTLPTKSTTKASKMLITDPFQFSFSRKFPDDNLKFE